MLPIENDSLHRSKAMASSNGGGTMTTNTSTGTSREDGSAMGYPLKYRNCRRSKLPKPVPPPQQQQQLQKVQKKYPSEELLYNEPNLIPKMELLKINYFNMPRKATVQLKQMTSRSRASVQDIKDDLIRKCGGGNTNHHINNTPSSSSAGASSGQQQTQSKTIKVPEAKYAVYKKHNLHDNDQHSSSRPTSGQQQQQHRVAKTTVADCREKNSKVFDFDSVKFRKKYFLFDTKKRSKLDNIQFYFDNKSYERHVDNKLYGSAQRPVSAAVSGSSGRKRDQQPPPTTTKLSTWKDHLNSTRLGGNVRELQSKYEDRVRQSSNSDSSNGQLRTPQKSVKKDDRDQRRESKSSRYGDDTDRLIKSTNRGSGQRKQDDKLINDRALNKKKHHHRLTRESTAENELSSARSSSKIKRLVQDFERKSPKARTTVVQNSVEGRENFILFQRMGSADNLLDMQRKTARGISGRKKSLDTLDVKVVNESKNRDSNYYLNEGNDRQEPLCKNIRAPRPTSMPVSSANEMVTTEQRLAVEKSVKSCGYKNCNFQNCPMTISSASTSSGCDSSNCSTLSFSDRNNSPINIVHKNRSVDDLGAPRHKTRTERIMDIKQMERRIVTKYISDEMKLISRGSREDLDDGYEPVSPPSRKSQGDYEGNKVKIYVSGGAGGVKGGGNKEKVFIEQLEDSDKDYGYYDQVTAESGSCSESSYASAGLKVGFGNGIHRPEEISDDSLMNVLEMGNDLMGKLGCDGAIFWNEGCYEDECKVQCSIKEPYVCVCGSSKVLELRLKVLKKLSLNIDSN